MASFKMVRLIKAGDVIEKFAYGGTEKMPVTVTALLQARQKGYYIVEGLDAKGQRIMVAAGHGTNCVICADAKTFDSFDRKGRPCKMTVPE